jgi:hypothetical protein
MVYPETIAVCFEQTGVSYRTKEESNPMETVTSSDGTTIAFDRLGDGPPVIVVGGQLCDRSLTRPTAEELAKRFTVFNYDRRGRGDSGDTAPYALEREVEDIGALIAEAGRAASVYGHSSGAALAIHAAAGVCLSPSSSCTSRPTTPRATSTASAPRARKPNTSEPCWQKTAATTRSSISGGPSGCPRRL